MKREALRRLRAVAIEPTYFDLVHEELDVEGVVSLIADTGANCIRLGALSHNGRAYFPSNVMPHAPGLRRRDIVAEFASECDKKGIVLGVYSNAAYVEQKLATHPDWWAQPYGEASVVREKKRKLVRLCHHSPYYDQWLEATREIVARYRPAFFYIDCFQLAPGCTCPFCRARLKRDLGYTRPPGANSAKLPEYHRWVERANYACAKRAFEAVRQTNEETLVVWNRGSFWGRAGYFPEGIRRFSTEFGDGYHLEAAVRLEQFA